MRVVYYIKVYRYLSALNVFSCLIFFTCKDTQFSNHFQIFSALSLHPPGIILIMPISFNPFSNSFHLLSLYAKSPKVAKTYIISPNILNTCCLHYVCLPEATDETYINRCIMLFTRHLHYVCLFWHTLFPSRMQPNHDLRQFSSVKAVVSVKAMTVLTKC